MSYTEGVEDPRAAMRADRDRMAKRDGLEQRQERVWRAAETAANALDTLVARLAPVLLPERAEPGLASLTQDPDDTSPLATFLDHLAERLDAIGRGIARTSERVDL